MIEVEWDDLADVLYVGPSSCIASSRESPSDYGMIFDLDGRGHVVALRLLGVSELSRSWWGSHPDVDMVPSDLRIAVDAWLAEHARDSLPA